MTTYIKKWEIFCNVEKKFKIVWDTVKPTTCPTNSAHAVNLSSIHYLVEVKNFKDVDQIESPYSVANINVYRCITSTGNIILNLPNISTIQECKVYIIQKIGASNTVNIVPYVGNGLGFTLNTDHQTIKLLVNKTSNNWTMVDIATSVGEKNGLLEPQYKSVVDTSITNNDATNVNGVPLFYNGDAVTLQLETFLNRAPTVTDDRTTKKYVGSRWIDTTTSVEYICTADEVGNANWIIPNTGSTPGSIMHWVFSDTRTTGTNGDDSVAGVWTTCALNTVELTSGPTIAIATNSIKFLSGGTYNVKVKVIFNNTGDTLLRLWNVTDSAEITRSLSTVVSGVQVIELNVRAVINTPKTYQIQYICNNNTVNGLGLAVGLSGESEKYVSVEIDKIA